MCLWIYNSRVYCLLSDFHKFDGLNFSLAFGMGLIILSCCKFAYMEC